MNDDDEARKNRLEKVCARIQALIRKRGVCYSCEGTGHYFGNPDGYCSCKIGQRLRSSANRKGKKDLQ